MLPLIQPTLDREHKLHELKRKLISHYGSSLLPVFINLPSLLPYHKNDTEQLRQEKLQENRQIMKMREEELQTRESEFIAELDKLVERIRQAGGGPNSSGSLATSYDSQYLLTATAAAAGANHLVCERCGNKDRDYFVTDPLRGDTICLGVNGTGCGFIALDHEVHQGAEKRNFENEEDRNHFGPPPNKLMPDVVNLETSFNIAGNMRDNAVFKRIVRTRHSVEMNLSKLGREDRHTRQGYKTQQSREAFALMEEIGGNLNLHQQVVNRAKEVFAYFRDVKEAVHKFEGIVLACLVIAYEDLSQYMVLDERPINYISTSSYRLGTSSPSIPPLILTQTNDPLLQWNPDLPLGNFSWEQLKEWLNIVAQEAMKQHPELSVDFTQRCVDHLWASLHSEAQKLQIDQSSQRVKMIDKSSSIFTRNSFASRLARRNERSNGTTNSISSDSSSSSAVTGGKVLLNIDLHQTIQSMKSLESSSLSSSSDSPDEEHGYEVMEKFFQQAIRRRSQVLKFKAEIERSQVLERKRLHIEASNTIPARKKLAQQYLRSQQTSSINPSPSPSQQTSSIAATNVPKLEIVEASLEDLIGGSITTTIVMPTVVKSMALSSTASQAVKAVDSLPSHPVTAMTSSPAQPLVVSVENGSVASNQSVPIRNSSPAIYPATNGNAPPASSAPGSGAKVAETKKPGMRPRPKIVLS